MTAPLSNDLRKRVVAAVGSGDSCRTVAARFGVAVSSVVNWSQLSSARDQRSVVGPMPAASIAHTA
jgi:transposase